MKMRARKTGRNWKWQHFVICSILSLIVFPADSNGFEQKEYIDGMNKVRVVVEFRTREAGSSGLSKSQIQNDVESRLNDSRIPVADGNDSTAPALFVGISLADVTTTTGGYRRVGYSYYININVAEEATLQRNNKKFPVITWSRATMGVLNGDGFKEELGMKLGDLIDSFAGDYLAANR